MYCSLCKERPYLSEGKIQLYPKQHTGASLVAQKVKHLPAMQETWVWSLGREDRLEKEMATHSSILAWKIPWMEEPGRLQSLKELDTTEQLHFLKATYLSRI